MDTTCLLDLADIDLMAADEVFARFREGLLRISTDETGRRGWQVDATDMLGTPGAFATLVSLQGACTVLMHAAEGTLVGQALVSRVTTGGCTFEGSGPLEWAGP